MTDFFVSPGASYIFGGISVATAGTAVAILLIGTTVLIRGRSTFPSFLYFVFTCAASGWLLAFAMMYAAQHESVALGWARVGLLAAAALPPALFHLVTQYDSHRALRRRVVHLCWAVAMTVGAAAAATPIFVPAVRRFEWGFYPRASAALILLLLVHATITFGALSILWQTYRRSEGRAHERAGSLILASILGSFGFVDILPAIGTAVYPVGYTAVLGFVIVSVGAVWRHDLVDLTPEYASSQILATMKSAVIVIDMDGTIRVANQAACSLLGRSMQELIGTHMRHILGDDENSSTRRILNTTGVLEQTMTWAGANGARVDVLTSSSFVRDAAGNPVGVVYAASDYTGRKKAEEALRESEARYRNLFERNLAGVYRSTIGGKILDCNVACARIFGFETRNEMLNQPALSLYFSADDREGMLAILQKDGVVTDLEIKMRRKDGSAVWLIENVTMLEPGVMEGTIIDITDRKYVQEQMEFRAYHDILTGLPNRILFHDRVDVALARARRSGQPAAIMFLDLDEFKSVNDRLGHEIGDRLLQVVAARLVNSVRQEDTVGRLGGDEFTVLLSGVSSDGSGASTVARKILDTVSETIIIDTHELSVQTSIGIALYPGDGFDTETLLKSADRAMYRAKQLGRNNYQYATPPPFDDRRSLQTQLERALEREEFVLHYQPVADVASGAIVAAEALIRWKNPTGRLVLPEEFMPAAEECDVILPLGDWVVRTACAQMKSWHDRGHSSMRVCVNLTARQFQQRDLPAVLTGALEDSGLPAHALEVEITESTAMQNAELSLMSMRLLREIGIRVAIDGFGTGYSSLSYLRRFPIDTVKIDERFMKQSEDHAILVAAIAMAKALSLRVVAEGVETAEQMALLRRHECAEVQGFFIAPPLPGPGIESLLRATQPRVG